MGNILKSTLSRLYCDKTSPDAILIVLGAFGWFISMLAQLGAIKSNDKLPEDKKKFLLLQEKNDGLCNIASYLLVTTTMSKFSKHLVEKGLIISKKITDDILRKNGKKAFSGWQDIIKKINSKDINTPKNLTEFVANNYPELSKDVVNFKKGIGVLATIVGSVISCNIITPILRNKMSNKALKIQTGREVKAKLIDNWKIIQTPAPFKNNNVFNGIARL